MDSIDKNKIKVRTTVYEPFLNIDFEKKIAFFEELIKVGIDNCIDSQEKDRILIIQIKRINHLSVIRFVSPDKGFRINKRVFDYLNNNESIDYNESVDKKLSIVTCLFVINDQWLLVTDIYLLNVFHHVWVWVISSIREWVVDQFSIA